MESRVCKFWLAGRCNRHPCKFLHGGDGELPSAHAQDPIRTSARPPNSKSRNLVWINPRNGGGGSGPKGGDRPCQHFLSDSCTYGDRCRFLHRWSIGDGFSLHTTLKGHEEVRSPH